MEPATITAIAQLTLLAINKLSANAKAKWSNEGWHGLTQFEKEQFAKEALNIAFNKACELKQSPKEIFWQIVYPHIYRQSEKNYGSWFMKNTWLINPEFIPAFEQQYGLMYEEQPKCNLKTTLKQIPRLYYVMAGIILLIIILKIILK